MAAFEAPVEGHDRGGEKTLMAQNVSCSDLGHEDDRENKISLDGIELPGGAHFWPLFGAPNSARRKQKVEKMAG